MAWQEVGGAQTGGANVPIDPLVHWLGTRNAAPLIIRTENTTAAPMAGTEVMRFTPAATGRRVGIGTEIPQRRLHVEPTEIHSGGSQAGLSFGNRLDLFNLQPSPFVDNPTGGARWVWYATEGRARLWSRTDKIVVTPTAGNVGIGAEPTQKLTLGSGNVLLPNANVGTDGNLYFGGMTNTGQTGLRLFGGLVNGAIPAGFIDVRTDTNTDGLRIRVDTVDGGIERMRITAQGRVGIGITNPQFPLDVAGSAHATSFPTSSDARLKTNVKQLTNVLDKLEKIRAVSFQWNELCKSLGRSTDRTEIGVIAQEVEAVFPELVTTWGDESYEAVDYGRLTGILIEAVKELKAQNEVLRSRIEALERA